ncbi:hypothetical protein BN946_scf184830.g4 [Trametes cinnabarina]|uniref:DNA/pantothenate metabolism flavoprotein C-terminal domain-containing protein n=1 Tax=Pycnoporus cinnabarinus TaxID=5643 RepID=A0A060S8Y6_PYCCI|nr:hypothetical protein BN946_scf184830.g4 [Trametes cinnabarina]
MATSSQSEAEATFSAERYFATQPPPASLEHDVARVKEFVQRQLGEGRKVVLVTSGGTTVPLELNVVRFLDNFSAEYFLKAGYAVIFMHRQFSLQPFSRHYSHSTHPFLDFLDFDPSGDRSEASHIVVRPSERAQLVEVLTAYKAVQRAGILLTLNFVTVNDYLWLLRAVSQEMSLLGRNCLYYLAAAVSDFFLPRQRMSEHKIQSGKGSLHIEMDQVPKILKSLVQEWTREGFIVSFKLETDPDLLIPKARQALARYGHQVVIGNDLHRRKFEVVFVSPRSSAAFHTSTQGSSSGATTHGYEESWLRIDLAQNPKKEIEEDIVAELVKRHQRWIEAAVSRSSPAST